MKVPSRAVLAGVLLVSLLLAGVVSFYAASTPDGLTKVAEDEGFAATETDHETADGPFADYSTRGVDDERLSGGVAGVAGVLVTLVIAGGIAYAVRRRTPADRETADHETADHETADSSL